MHSQDLSTSGAPSSREESQDFKYDQRALETMRELLLFMQQGLSFKDARMQILARNSTPRSH